MLSLLNINTIDNERTFLFYKSPASVIFAIRSSHWQQITGRKGGQIGVGFEDDE
jgi:hypothetical protein